MKKATIHVQRTALSALMVLLPALLFAQAVEKKPPEKPQTVDLGVFQVSAPPEGKWDVAKSEDPLGVTFSKYKKDLLHGVLGPGTGLGQERGTQAGVTLKVLKPQYWPMTEAMLLASITRYSTEAIAKDPEAPGVLADKGETDLKEKKLYFLEFNRSSGLKLQSFYYIYLPPDFKKTHRYFEFFSHFERKGGFGQLKLYRNPGSEPVLQLVESLEIVDPLQDVPGPDGELLRAAAAGDIDAAKQAVDKGAKADAAAPHLTALSAGCLYGHREIVDFLLGQGADVNKADIEGGRTPLHQALIGNEAEIAGILVRGGADLDPRTLAGFSPLMYASIYGHSGLASTLLERGADVHARTNAGETALIFAARCGSVEIAQLLMAKGADPNAQANDGWTALMRAVEERHPDIARSLLERGADVGLKSEKGWTALMEAIQAGDLEIVKALIDRGADINSKMSGVAWTPLLYALSLEGPDAIALALIKAGADVKAKLGGTTTLMFAAENASADIVRLLLEKGVDVNAKNSDKRTALKYASKKNRADIVQILKAAGAKG